MLCCFVLIAFFANRFFGFCIIWTLSSMVQTIVDEKRRRIKEGMLMMGLQTHVYWATWITVYSTVFCFVAFRSTIH